MPTTLREGAIFIADAHYPHYGTSIFRVLNKLENASTTPPPQLFLMGDIFDLLFGYNTYIQGFSTPLIQRLQRLSEKIEIHYLEGNHDFCLETIFPQIKIYPREQQPVLFTLQHQNVYLAHGDRYARPWSYELYTKILRHPYTLKLLKPFEKAIINHRMYKLQQKNICGSFETFENHVHAICQHYPKEALILEGHFHQGKKIGNYLSLPSLVCQKAVAVLREGTIQFIPIDQL